MNRTTDMNIEHNKLKSKELFVITFRDDYFVHRD